MTVHSPVGVARLVVVVSALAAVLCWGMPARAQTQAELRAEVARLTEENRRLRAELESAQQRMRELEARSGALLRALSEIRALAAAAEPSEAGGGREAAPAASSDPFASPEALLADLRKEYASSFPEGVPPVTEEVARRRYQERVETWCRVMNRSRRSPVEWQAKSISIEGDRGAYRAEVELVDPADPDRSAGRFTAAMPDRIAERIQREGDRAGGWRITGVMTARPRFNPERTEAGTFDVPPFIGPFAEFGYDLEFTGVAAVRAEERPAEPGPGTTDPQPR